MSEPINDNIDNIDNIQKTDINLNTENTNVNDVNDLHEISIKEISIKEINSWEELDAKIPLLRGIYNYGFEKPSPIQRKAILPIFSVSSISFPLTDVIRCAVFTQISVSIIFHLLYLWL